MSNCDYCGEPISGASITISETSREWTLGRLSIQWRLTSNEYHVGCWKEKFGGEEDND